MGSADRPGKWGRIAFGIVLVTAGVVLLALQALGPDLGLNLGRIGWPLLVMVPGIALLVAGLLVSDDGGVGVAIGGSIVTVIGMLLAYQSATGHWATWAYAWALVAPGGVGLGMLLWGTLHRRAALAAGGVSAVLVGVTLFAVGFGFFEGVLDLSGDPGLGRLAGQVLPVALIGAGIVMIATRLVRADRWRPGGGTEQPPG